MRTFSITTLCLSIVLVFTLSCATTMAQNTEDFIIWSQSSAYKYSLKMSVRHDNRWSSPEMIEESHKQIIVPTLSLNQNGDIFTAWTELNGVQGRIRYKIKRRGAWESVQELKTTTFSDMAPSVAIDTDETPWMVWSGTDNTDADIYFSRLIGNQWETPKRVNNNDEWPDILPAITIDGQKRITVTWKGYNGDRYVRYSCFWIGTRWSQESVLGEIPIIRTPANQVLPDFIPKGSRGSLYQRESKMIRKFVKTAPTR